MTDKKVFLEEAKLKVELASDENTAKANGTVLKQSIEPGSTVEEGTTVIITINRLTELKYGTVNVNVKSFNAFCIVFPMLCEAFAGNPIVNPTET